MHERKLIQVGNSTGVTLPPEVLEALELKAGDWLQLEVTGDTLAHGPAVVITKSDLKARTKEHGEEVRQHRAAIVGTSTGTRNSTGTRKK